MAEQRRSGTFDNKFKFNGKELDSETGLYYYGARYYNPRTSVWLSVDPIALWQPVQESEHYILGQHNGGFFNPKNMSVYGYTYQNPIVYIDPNGKQNFFMDALNGLGDAAWSGLSYIYNNPNHRGYSIAPKPITQSELAAYPGWGDFLDPYFHINSFSNMVGTGIGGTIEGIANGDGYKVGQSFPSLLGTAGSLYGFKTSFKGFGVSRFSIAQQFYKNAGFGTEAIASHMKGINFLNPLKV